MKTQSDLLPSYAPPSALCVDGPFHDAFKQVFTADEKQRQNGGEQMCKLPYVAPFLCGTNMERVKD